MEPKSCVAHYDAANDAFDLWVPTQGTADLRNALALITGVAAERIRVHSDDVGGGFGIRNEVYPEFLAVMLAAKKIGRAVKWRGTRSETLSGDHHARAADLSGELALDRDGRFIGVRVQWLVNIGAFCANAGPLINTIAAPTSSAISLYNVPAIYGRHQLVFTNTTPTTAYRGAGRPNVSYLWERMVEEAATATGIDSVKLRRINFLRKKMFPMRTPTGSNYDSADPERLLKTALASLATGKALPSGSKRCRKTRQAARHRRWRCFSNRPAASARSRSKSASRPTAVWRCTRTSARRGKVMKRSSPIWLPEVLGFPRTRSSCATTIADAPKMAGTGSFGSRSLISHGGALTVAAREMVEKGRKLAAGELEVAAADVVFDNGHYTVVGTDLKITMQSLIEKKWDEPTHPLNTNTTIDLATAFPSGAHVAEVEIDPDTGELEILNYIAADDCGTIYSHKLVEGQLHGGLMQGVGQVIGEHVAYERDSGQLISGSFMDYFMPRAMHAAPTTLIDCGVPSPANALGAKGAGEAGATGSVPALANAVLDALKAGQCAATRHALHVGSHLARYP